MPKVGGVLYIEFSAAWVRYCSMVGIVLVPLLDQIVTDDHQHNTGWAEVFLRAGVDQAVFPHVNGTAVHVAGGVGHQRNPGRSGGLGLPLRTEDGVVRGEVNVGRTR